MASSAVLNVAFEPGQQVKCETRFGDIYAGEVVAFDLNSNILIIKSPSASGNSSNRDLHFLMLEHVKDIDLIEEPQADFAKDLPSIEMKYIESRQKAALDDRLRLVKAIENGVSQDGISLFSSLMKMYDKNGDLFWKDNVKIVVLNSVVIKPPYKESDCELLSPGSSEDSSQNSALAYVKTVVKKFWENP